MELHQAVAGNIHRIRKSQRLSMDRAAELAGISVSMWGQVERGSVNPTLAVLGKIADIMDLPAGNVYVIRGGEREIMVPAVPQFIAETNVEGGYIKVRLIEGMRTDV